MKALLPIVLMIVSIALFFLQVTPLYSEVKGLRAESAQYDEALGYASELETLRVELAQKLESFPDQDLARLDHFLPRRLDTVRIILDVDGIALRNGVRLADFAVGEPKATQSQAKGKTATTNTGYSTVSLGFTFTSSYGSASQFIRDLQRSLRLLDITMLTVKPSNTVPGQYDFNISLDTYWINR
jgi:hypothetical protein